MVGDKRSDWPVYEPDPVTRSGVVPVVVLEPSRGRLTALQGFGDDSDEMDGYEAGSELCV